MKRRVPPATRRYVIRLAVLMTLYMIALFTAVGQFKHGHPTGALAWALAIAPGLPVAGVFWAVLRLIVETTDEYLRLLLVRQTLIATGLTMSIATVWGFLENFGMVAHIEAFYWAMLWFLGLGVGALFNKLTLGDTGSCQ